MYTARVARFGEIRKGLRTLVLPRELLFDDSIVSQFNNARVCLGHVHRRAVGRAVFPRIVDGTHIVCELVIDVPLAARAIELGRRDISLAWVGRSVVRTIEGRRVIVYETFSLSHIGLVRFGACGDTYILNDDEARELREREQLEDDELEAEAQTFDDGDDHG